MRALWDSSRTCGPGSVECRSVRPSLLPTGCFCVNNAEAWCCLDNQERGEEAGGRGVWAESKYRREGEEGDGSHVGLRETVKQKL